MLLDVTYGHANKLVEIVTESQSFCTKYNVIFCIHTINCLYYIYLIECHQNITLQL